MVVSVTFPARTFCARCYMGWGGGVGVLCWSMTPHTHTHTHTHGGGNTHVACTHTLYHMDAGHMSAQEFRQSRESHLSTNRSSVQRIGMALDLFSTGFFYVSTGCVQSLPLTPNLNYL